MLLKKLLTENRTSVSEKWCHLILESYPEDTIKVFSRTKDRFQNPVGYNISESVKLLYDGLVNDVAPADLAEPVDNIVRIRSVQDFSPSQAVSFMFLLKKIVRETFKEEIAESRLYDELQELDLRIDRLALTAFDTYMQCREKIFEIRMDQARSMPKPIERLNKKRRKPGICE